MVTNPVVVSFKSRVDVVLDRDCTRVGCSDGREGLLTRRKSYRKICAESVAVALHACLTKIRKFEEVKNRGLPTSVVLTITSLHVARMEQPITSIASQPRS